MWAADLDDEIAIQLLLARVRLNTKELEVGKILPSHDGGKEGECIEPKQPLIPLEIHDRRGLNVIKLFQVLKDPLNLFPRLLDVICASHLPTRGSVYR